MSLKLNGIMPEEIIDFIWIGDSAVDIEASDIKQWYEEGTGLVLKDDLEPTVFKLKPLNPSVKNYIYGIPSSEELEDKKTDINEMMSYENCFVKHIAAVWRQCCAYGIQSISAVKLAKVNTALGKKLSDDMLTSLEKDIPEQIIEINDKDQVTVSILSQIGKLLLRIAMTSEHQKKV